MLQKKKIEKDSVWKFKGCKTCLRRDRWGIKRSFQARTPQTSVLRGASAVSNKTAEEERLQAL